MAFVRHYIMIAKEGEVDALRKSLEELAASVAPLEGCEGVELYQDADTCERFVFLERWQSADLHKEGGKKLGKEAFAPIMAALARPPEAASLTSLQAN